MATTERACAGCRLVLTDDPSGFCEDCQEGIASEKPGSISDSQRDALIGLLIDQGLIANWTERAALMKEAVPEYGSGSDLSFLSQRQAGDLLEFLEARRLSREM